ncbi:hypothetical protein ASPBRDRAFT_55544 [Aspergillus brasiliensis CBS 101740]|uniref:Uncharacterized protein n=1 Tax=Aspergillus brasiliensis (strain CBS 101740 / IMI 381727 / IBT 21946) TaxID=767769 RepID=A0A1L9UGR5_ASPBC|nr:hypothetical protein ASPBRDRAFT_55544 [Aspergillus brasiliensis CBS 101740]
MVELVKVPQSHIRAVPCISGIRHKPLPKAALQLDENPLVQRNGGANSFSDSPLVGGQAGGVLSHVMRKNYEGLNFGSGQSGRLDRQVPVTEKCASWIVQAQLLQGGRSTVRTLRRARALFAIRPALAVRRPWDPGSPEEVILDVCAGVRSITVAWETLEAGLLGPLFSSLFPTVTGTEIHAGQRQADGRKMPPEPLKKQIRLVECGTGLDPSCTKHGGRSSTVKGMQMGMKKYEEVLHDTRPSPDPRSEDGDRSAAAPHSSAADLPFPRMREGIDTEGCRGSLFPPLAVGYYLHAARCESVTNSSRLYTALTGWEEPHCVQQSRCLQNRLATLTSHNACRQRLKEHFRSLSSVPGTWDYVRNVGGYGLMHAPSLIPPNQSRVIALGRAATCYTIRLEGKCATLGPLSCTFGIVVL